MLKLISKVQSYVADKKGATAIEYGLIAAGVALGISVIVFTFGADLRQLFTDVSTAMNARPA